MCRLRKKTAWKPLPKDDTDIELSLSGLAWKTPNGPRTLAYNIKVPLIKKNVDLCLFDCTSNDLKASVGNPKAYIALGELKGGIDPAGADEHWKTARTALQRIRTGFEGKELSIHTFFIGAAIEESMATEIWDMLESCELENAANLTNDNHIAAVVQWLCTL